MPRPEGPFRCDICGHGFKYLRPIRVVIKEEASLGLSFRRSVITSMPTKSSLIWSKSRSALRTFFRMMRKVKNGSKSQRLQS